MQNKTVFALQLQRKVMQKFDGIEPNVMEIKTTSYFLDNMVTKGPVCHLTPTFFLHSSIKIKEICFKSKLIWIFAPTPYQTVKS